MKYFLLLFVISIYSCNKKQKTIQPEIKSITESVYASGMIKSQNQYKVFSTVSGIVNQVFVEENDVVRSGQALFSIANEAQELLEKNAQLNATFNAVNGNQGKLDEAQEMLNVAKQKMKSEELMYDRQKNLWSQEIGSKVELEQRALVLENAKANFQSALQRYNDLKRLLKFSEQQSQNNLKISTKNSKDLTVKSSIDGRIYQINIAKGELITPQTPLAIIGDDHKFILEMQVDEYDIISIKTGMSVSVVLNSYKDAVFTAKVTKINPIMNSQSKTFTVEAEFINQPPLLFPSISFEANILLKSKANALLIPRSYLANDSTVLLSSGEKRKVKTGLKDLEKVEIIQGLDKNDKLILPQE